MDLRQRYRAVSSEDFEQLVLQDWHETPTAKALGLFGVVARARCLSQQNLALTEPTAKEEPAPGHISLLVVPQTLADNYSLLSFDGEDDYLEIPHSDQLNFDNNHDFTIEVWVRPEKVQARTKEIYNSILEKRSDYGSFPYGIRYENQSGKIQVIRSDGTNFASISSTKAINDYKFHHIAFVKDSSIMYLYIDGELEGFTEDINSDNNIDNTINTSSLYLGCQGNQSHYFQGTITQLRIWEGVRLQADIKQEMNNFLKGTEKGLVGYWNLDRDSGTIAHDHTPKRNHGTIQGASWYQPNITANLLQGLWSFLDERRLLTVRHHVVIPDYLPLRVWARLYLVTGGNAEQVQNQANQEAKAFFHPVNSRSYWDGQGWPFGRSIYVSELYQLLDRIPGVDYVEDVMVHTHELTTTVLTQASPRSQTQITVKDTTGFNLGDTIQLDPSSSDQEYYTISSIEEGLKQLTLSSALNKAYGLGTIVVRPLNFEITEDSSNPLEFKVNQVTGLAAGDRVGIIPTNSNPENQEIDTVDYSSNKITLKQALSETPTTGTKVVQLGTWREERSKPKETYQFIEKELIRVKLRNYELVDFNVQLNLVIMEYIGEQWQLSS
ncbi:MAG: hypothetical protein F6K65_33490 [Moorea sp. SIO3C2]|nr:hypothetical protein [Moorena sp. SIO3C2]